MKDKANVVNLESTFYLGASLSSWTQTVLIDRLARKNLKHDSVLKVVTNGKRNVVLFQLIIANREERGKCSFLNARSA